MNFDSTTNYARSQEKLLSSQALKIIKNIIYSDTLPGQMRGHQWLCHPGYSCLLPLQTRSVLGYQKITLRDLPLKSILFSKVIKLTRKSTYLKSCKGRNWNLSLIPCITSFTRKGPNYSIDIILNVVNDHTKCSNPVTVHVSPKSHTEGGICACKQKF